MLLLHVREKLVSKLQILYTLNFRIVTMFITDPSQQYTIFNVLSFQDPNASGTSFDSFDSTSQGNVSAMVLNTDCRNLKK